MRMYGWDSVGSSLFTVAGSNRFRGPIGFEVAAKENSNKFSVGPDSPHSNMRSGRPTLSSQQHADRGAAGAILILHFFLVIRFPNLSARELTSRWMVDRSPRGRN